MNRVLLILAILLCALSEGVAQNFQKVTGTVSDREGTLPGVNVFNLRSKNGTVTDVNGAYSIEAHRGDVLQFSYIGMETVEKKSGDANIEYIHVGKHF